MILEAGTIRGRVKQEHGVDEVLRKGRGTSGLWSKNGVVEGSNNYDEGPVCLFARINRQASPSSHPSHTLPHPSLQRHDVHLQSLLAGGRGHDHAGVPSGDATR